MSLPFSLSKTPIASHCFSADRSHLAITQGNDVLLYNMSITPPKLVATLKHHDKPITCVDIAADGKIVTCSQDRNALVWTPVNGEYKQTLVLLRINRAATVVRWSPNSDKFAVGSSARVISVCFYEEENDWWISKHIKKPLKSTILSLDWHQNNVLLSCGSTDGHVRVFSTWIKGIDPKPEATIWGTKLPFQTLCLEVNVGAWVHDVKFDPSYQSVAAVGHDGSLFVIYPQGDGTETPVPYQLSKTISNGLPFTSLLYIDEAKIVTAGFDCHPLVFINSGNGQWEFSYSIDDPKNKKLDEATKEQTALNMFRAMDLKGSTQVKSKLDTIHQNTINEIRMFQKGANGVIRFSTCGDDGVVVVWDA
ncbi:Arc40 protein [Martiniozyma asiatica (nom. inval.)]|nr:Arc40 protein [Martiniozyma asiatica]